MTTLTDKQLGASIAELLDAGQGKIELRDATGKVFFIANLHDIESRPGFEKAVALLSTSPVYANPVVKPRRQVRLKPWLRHS